MNRYHVLAALLALALVLCAGTVGFTLGFILGPVGVILSLVFGWALGTVTCDLLVDLWEAGESERYIKAVREWADSDD